jgi:succinyl-diaminopimelate desuccinylase
MKNYTRITNEHSGDKAVSETLQLACDLISRASVTPEDAGCQDLMIERLEAIDFEVTRLPFGDVQNFWAERGDSGPIMVFAGHTDVVPTGPEADWTTPPFEPTIIDGILYGRGAADMKGSLAAMITATEAFVLDHPYHSGRIGFLITSDEEGPATDGTVRVINWLQEQEKLIDMCLVGEPSSTDMLGDIIKNGRRGSLGGQLIVEGEQGHIAYPHLADNPIHRLAPALSALVAEHWDDGNEFFPPTSFQISNIRGGTGASNVIPGTVTVDFNFRFATTTTAEELQQRTTRILDDFDLRYQLTWALSGNPFLTPRGPLVDATLSAIWETMAQHAELSTAGGTSDGRFIAPYGAQVIELGPINASIHKLDEHVEVTDLDLLAEIYRLILEKTITGGNQTSIYRPLSWAYRWGHCEAHGVDQYLQVGQVAPGLPVQKPYPVHSRARKRS